MRRADAWIGWWVLVFLVSIGTARAEDPRLSLFERYNRASSGDEVKPLVSGTLARQYGVLASKEEELRRVLKAQQFATYRARVVELDDKTTFLVVEDGRAASGGRAEAQAYLLSKGAGGDWTLADRFLARSIIKTLWTATFAPAQFNQASQCSMDGQEIGPRSALAVREKDVIRISLYPFPFSQSDLDYWRQVGGLRGADAPIGSHFHDGKFVTCVLTLGLDGQNGVSLFNVGREPEPGAQASSKVWQAPKSEIARLEIGKNRIVLDTTGQLGTGTDGVQWKVKVDLPVWERGL